MPGSGVVKATADAAADADADADAATDDDATATADAAAEDDATAADATAAPFPIPWSVWLRHQPAADVRSFSIAALVRQPVGPDQQAAVTVSRVH